MTRIQLIFGLAGLLVCVGLATACASEDSITSAAIVSEVPWRGPETASYRVLDSDDNPVGTLELGIAEESAGAWRLTQSFDFPDKGFTNESEVIVDGSTLQPESSTFNITGPEGNFDCSAEYTTRSVNMHRVGEDGERDDTLSIPDVAYDSWGDLFVWRTITFADGYQQDYADVLACTLSRPEKIGVSLKIDERDQISVPAGSFDAWHLEIGSGGETQDAWYTTDDAHVLLKYDNGESTFELMYPPDS
jgi:hypothetical protein